VDFQKGKGLIMSEGYIELQAQSALTEFRKVELLSLMGCMDKKASNFNPYFVQVDNTSCKY